MVTPLINRRYLQMFDLNFNPKIVASEEYNLFMRLLAKGKACAIPNILGVWRITEGTLTDRAISSWASDRFLTLEQLKNENPGIEQQYIGAFSQAAARGHYYRARYHYSQGEIKNARSQMKSSVIYSKKYIPLLMVCHFPFLWNILHSQFFKRRVFGNLANMFFSR